MENNGLCDRIESPGAQLAKAHTYVSCNNAIYDIFIMANLIWRLFYDDYRTTYATLNIITTLLLSNIPFMNLDLIFRSTWFKLY